MATGKYNFAGAYKGTGAELTLDACGFAPKSIRFVNMATGATADWIECMNDLELVTHDSGVDAVDTTTGVTRLVVGFKIGANAIVNTAGQTIRYFVVGD